MIADCAPDVAAGAVFVDVQTASASPYLVWFVRAAIREPNPVIFIENRLLYGRKGPRPPADYLVPLGKAGSPDEPAPPTAMM